MKTSLAQLIAELENLNTEDSPFDLLDVEWEISNEIERDIRATEKARKESAVKGEAICAVNRLGQFSHIRIKLRRKDYKKQ